MRTGGMWHRKMLNGELAKMRIKGEIMFVPLIIDEDDFLEIRDELLRIL